MTVATPSPAPAANIMPESSPKPAPATTKPAKKTTAKPQPDTPPAAEAEPESKPPTPDTPEKPKNPKKTSKAVVDSPDNSPSETIDESRWSDVLGALKSEYNTLYSIVRMAQPQFDDSKITLTFSFMFHQKRLNEAKNKAIVAQVLSKVYGRDIELECLFDKLAKPAPASTATPVSGSLDTISNIFGGGELLES
jgi:hypothetical protein